MRLWSAPALPACTCCTACADLAFRRGCSRQAAGSAAPGTGTAIRARAATSRACSIRSPSRRSWTRNGTGRRSTRRNLKSSPTPTISPIASIFAGISCSTRASSRRRSMKKPSCWQIETDRGDRVSAKFCIMAVGCLSAPNRPAFKGIQDFRGPVYHTGEWPHQGVDFTGLRVGVIGTGSSAIQSIPIIAQQASALTVFQRTATWSVPAWNEKLTPEYRQAVKADYPSLRAKARARPTGFYFPFNMKPALEAEPRGSRTAVRRSLGTRRPALSRRLRRSAVRKSRQRHHRRLCPRARSAASSRIPATAELLCPGQCFRLQAPLRRYRLLRDLQPAARQTGRRLEDADRALHRRRHRGRRRRIQAGRHRLRHRLCRHDGIVRQDQRSPAAMA